MEANEAVAKAYEVYSKALAKAYEATYAHTEAAAQEQEIFRDLAEALKAYCDATRDDAAEALIAYCDATRDADRAYEARNAERLHLTFGKALLDTKE